MNAIIDGYEICYKITGTAKETVVMLQGWGTEFGIYNSIANILNKQYTFVQFDFPGFGNSEEPREAWDVDAYADFFCRFMQYLGIENATLIGHSYGGRVIIKLAARKEIPFKIERIVLIDSAGILPQKSLWQKWKIQKYKVIKKIFNLRVIYALFPEIIDDWRNRQGSEDYRQASMVMRQCLVKAVNEDLTTLLDKIQQDTLLIWGENDTATPLTDGKLMEKKIAGSGLVILKNAGHFSFLDQPQIFENVFKSYFRIGESYDY